MTNFCRTENYIAWEDMKWSGKERDGIIQEAIELAGF